MRARTTALLLCMASPILLAQIPPAGDTTGTAVPPASDPAATPAEIDRASPGRSVLGKERLNQAPIATSVQTDSVFVAQAGKSGATQIAAGKLALSKSKSEKLKTFARHMIRDHGKLLEQVNAVTRAEKTETPPAEADESTMAMLQPLAGEAFDQAYIEHVAIAAHERAIDAFGAEAAKGASPALKQTAQAGLRLLKRHLEMARQLAEK